MQIFPAIDLHNGNSVRLYQGDFDKSTLVAADPRVQAKTIAKSGLNLHLVDLDGAKAGKPQNQTLIFQIRQENPDLFMEVGGGIRTLEDIQTYLNAGINRVILGSAALLKPELVQKALTQYSPEQIAVGIDGRNGYVAVKGWLKNSQTTIAQLMAQMVNVGVKYFIITDIDQDGTLQGPNIKLLSELQQQFPQSVITASGGIADIEDVKAVDKAGIPQVIIGKALAAKRITLAQLEAL